MRKRKNGKKKTIYLVLFIAVAMLIVGYAFLSSSLNIFGGLSIIGGNNWGVKWSNVVENSNSTASVDEYPTLDNDDTELNFQVVLDTPGDFYEFTVDAVNTGSIDAMIDDISYSIYDQNDELVDPSYLIYTVTYENGDSLSSYHLLRKGETATYLVRIEFDDGINSDELPQTAESYRFEFGVTYVQADDNAIEPGVLAENTFRYQNVDGDFYTFMFDEDMTWQQWVDSEYNQIGFIISGSYIMDIDGAAVYDEFGDRVTVDKYIRNVTYQGQY